ncbi:hypothetical protein GYMLUDRAFT_62185 [Collybiopsis luxurians FD-317 M1]|uniref:F-box domain-containing protein n=1 Tax=Collybiopsis luxurians FD-317 M1 TaxID=944289 RepID=A0A0D0AZH0_9AGAR|nr:hypothetical protein GYMLUDRAFT_62185 [Collybiopsis luxurians FD-317 M1]
MQLCCRCGEKVSNRRVDLNFTSQYEKLRAESGPISAEPQQVNLILESLEQDLKDVEREIVSSHRSCILEYANKLRCLLSPIRKIPNEILQVIFDICCYTNHFLLAKPSATDTPNSRYKPAMVLSSVCSRWRRNAFALPKIWSRLSLEWEWYEEGLDSVDAKVLALQEKLSSLLSNFFRRSLDHPMIIYLAFQASPLLQNNSFHPILELVAEQTYRWQKVSFYSEWCDLKDFFAHNSDPLRFPLLEDIRFSLDQCELEFFVDRTPKLTALRLPFSAGWPENYDFRQIRHLEQSPYRIDLVKSFEILPNLVSLVVAECYEGGSPTLDWICSPFSPLRNLTVRHGGISKVYLEPGYSVFPFFNFPSLEKLHLEPIQWFERPQSFWFNFDPLMEFVRRSSFFLTTLSIKSLALSDSNLVHLLHHVPNLRRLAVLDTYIEYQYSPITERPIESLRPSQTSQLRLQAEPIVPRLHSLILKTRAPVFRDRVVVDMVCSRWARPTTSSANSGSTGARVPAVDCLREFTLRFYNRKDPGAGYEPLQLIEKDGMRAVVSWMK